MAPLSPELGSVETVHESTGTTPASLLEAFRRSHRLMTLLSGLAVATPALQGCDPTSGKIILFEGVDEDGDGAYTESSRPDCDDKDASVHPDADEICDDKDNDCDGTTDEDAVDAPDWYSDADRDGYGDGSSEPLGRSCDRPEDSSGTVASNPADCNDSDSLISPAAIETPYDSIDQDCDGTDLTDVDEDGFAFARVEDGLDCDDTDASKNPEAGNCLVALNVSAAYDSAGYGLFIEDNYASSVLYLGAEGTPDAACQAAGYDSALAARVWDWYQCGGPNSSLALAWDPSDVALETLTIPDMPTATDCAGVVMGVGAYGFDGLTPEGQWVAGDTALVHPTEEEIVIGLNSGAHAVASCVKAAE